MKCQWVSCAVAVPPVVCNAEAEDNFCALHQIIWESATSNTVSIDPLIRGGQPCVDGTRIPVKMVMELRQNDISFGEIVRHYPTLRGKNLIGVVDWAKENEDLL